MDSRRGHAVMEDRLIDFIFQCSPEEQFDTMTTPTVEDSVSQSTLWNRFVEWVGRN